MKNVLLLISLLALVACDGKKGYTIHFEMKELAGGTIYLQQRVNREMVNIDSAVVDSAGHCILSGTVENPGMMYLFINDVEKSISFFLDNYKYVVNGNVDAPVITADGGPQVDYVAYKEEVAGFEEKMKQIRDLYYQADSTGITEDSLNNIIEAYYSVSAEKDVFDSLFMIDNHTIVSLYLLRNMYYSLSAGELEARLSVFDESLHETEYYKMLSDYLDRAKKVQIGEKFIDFEAQDTLGNPVKLSDLVGNGPLMIDFWASWCGPCRKANPDVVELYNEFKDKGFDILGVSLDRNKEDWLKAIKADNLTWHQVSDLKYWDSEYARLYAVSSIPHTVLIDNEGTIVARNLTKEKLKEKLSELLGS